MRYTRMAPIAWGLSLCASLSAQSFKQEIDLSGLGKPGASARPFGISVDSDSGRLFVGVFGDFFPDPSNNIVAVIDPIQDTVSKTIQVGEFPQDIAFLYDGQGKLVYGAVTNSSDGTVSVWDATDAVVATIALPDPFSFGTCFPFGITASEDRARFYISTQDGSGAIYNIEAATLTNNPAFDVALGSRSAARLQHRDDRLVVPYSIFTSSFSGAEAGVLAFDTTTNAQVWETLTVFRDGQNIFPAGQDLVFLPDGSLVLGGTFFDGRLYQFATDGELLRTIRLDTPGGSAQGLALSDDGRLLAVCDLTGDSVVLVDMLNFEQLALIDTQSVGRGYAQPNEAVFAQDKLYVTCQANEQVLVFDNLPTVGPGIGFAGTLGVSEATPLPGDFVDVDLNGPGKVALLAAFDDRGSTVLGLGLQLGPKLRLEQAGRGSLNRRYAIPNKAALKGLHLFLQGIVDAGGTPARTTPRVIVVQ